MNHVRIDGGLVVEIIPPALDDEGAEIAIERRFHPDFVAALVAIPDAQDVATGDTWTQEAGFGLPLRAPTFTAIEVLAQRDTLLALSTLRIAPLQYAVDLKDATDDEKAALKSWKQYAVALNRIEAQEGFPADVDWPKAPE